MKSALCYVTALRLNNKRSKSNVEVGFRCGVGAAGVSRTHHVVRTWERREKHAACQGERWYRLSVSRQSLPPSLCRSVCLFLCLSVCSSLCLSVCPSLFLSVCPSLFLSCLSVSLSVRPSFCPSVCLPVCLSVRPSVCLPVCLPHRVVLVSCWGAPICQSTILLHW